MGTATVNSTFGGSPTTINFQTAFAIPPAVFIIPNRSGGDPCHTRLFGTSATGFDVACVEPSSHDGPHIAMTVNYVAATPGGCDLNGTPFEVVCQDVKDVQGPTATGWQSSSFLNTYSSTPGFLAQIQSDNNGGLPDPSSDPACPWLTTATQSLGTSSVELALEQSEDETCAVTEPERVCYFAIEDEVFRFRDDEGAGVTCDTFFSTSEGWDEGCTDVDLTGLGDAPLAVGYKVTHESNDGGWVRNCGVGGATVGYVIDEDRVLDRERSSRGERISTFACSDAFHASALTEAVIESVHATTDTRGAVTVHFATSVEMGTLGFYLYAADDMSGPLHQEMLAADLESGLGAEYRVFDRAAVPEQTRTYFVVERERLGFKRYGPFEVEIPARPALDTRDHGLPQLGLPQHARTRVLDAELPEMGRTSRGLPLADVFRTARLSIREKALEPDTGTLEVRVDHDGFVAVAAPPGARRGRVCIRRRGEQVPHMWSGDDLVFFGQGPDDPQLPFAVYQVTEGRCRGARRIAQVTPRDPSVVFSERVHEDNRVPLTVLPATDLDIFRGAALHRGAPETTFRITAPRAEGPASVIITAQAVSERVSLIVEHDGEAVGTIEIPANERASSEVPLTLTSRDVSVTLRLADTSSSAFFDHATLRFASPAALEDGEQVQFTAERDERVTLTGDGPLWIIEEDTERMAFGDGEVAIRVERGHRYVALSGTPERAETHRGGLPHEPARSLDAVVIAPRILAEAALEVVALHEASGLNSEVAVAEDLYARYMHGEHHPDALRFYLREAAKAGARYALLLGDAHVDVRGHLGAGAPLLPSVLVSTPRGVLISDASLAPGEMTVGRLPVRDEADASAALRNLARAYESGPRQSVRIADNSDRAGDFARDLGALPLDGELIALSDSVTVAQAQEALADAVNDGASVLVYAGHGGMDRMTGEGLISTRNVEDLHFNDAAVVIAPTCWIGRGGVPTFQSLAEVWTTRHGGAAAVWATSGLASHADGQELTRGFLSASGDRLGDAVAAGYKRYEARTREDLAPFLTLFGDPAMPFAIRE